MLNDLFTEEWPVLRTANVSTPAVNVLEDEKSYYVEIAAPGMTKDDFSAHVNDQDALVIILFLYDDYQIGRAHV